MRILWLVLLLSISALARDYAQKFAGYQATWVSFDTATGVRETYNQDRAEQLFSPCSTFKVPNSLIVLEAGVVKDEDTVIPWDKVQRKYPDWNQDQTLRSALRVSALWAYQKLAEKVPLETYARDLKALDYGNQDLSGGVAAPFWQTSSLKVSANQQVAFLRRLQDGELPFSERNQDIVRDIMVLQKGDGWTLRGKTGSGVTQDRTRMLGWFVGYASRGSRSLVFAANLEGPNQPSTPPGGWLARDIVLNILREQGWIGPR